MVDQHEGRVGQIDEKAGQAKTTDEGERQEIAILEQQAIGRHGAAETAFRAGVLGPGFVNCVDSRIRPRNAAIVTAQNTPRQPKSTMTALPVSGARIGEI